MQLLVVVAMVKLQYAQCTSSTSHANNEGSHDHAVTFVSEAYLDDSVY
jgi:hypothetical protein